MDALADLSTGEETLDLIVLAIIAAVIAFIGYEIYQFVDSKGEFDPTNPTSVYAEAVAPGTILDSIFNANDCIAANGVFESVKSLFTDGSLCGNGGQQ